jgi:hypothetical protein
MSLTKATFSMIDGARVNVLDYGADPTLTNDSSAAFQSAINYAAENRLAVYIPSGRYLIGSTITLYSGGTNANMNVMYGDGGFNSQLIYSGTGSMFTVANGTLGNETRVRYEFSDLAFAAQTPGVGKCLTTPEYSFFVRNLMRNCKFSSFEIAIDVINAWQARFLNCEFSGNTTGGIYVDGANNWCVTDCQFRDNVGYGIKINTESVGMSITGNLFSFNGEEAIILMQGCDAAHIAGNYFEGNGSTASPANMTVRIGDSQHGGATGNNFDVTLVSNYGQANRPIYLYNASDCSFVSNSMSIIVLAPAAGMSVTNINLVSHHHNAFPVQINSAYLPELIDLSKAEDVPGKHILSDNWPLSFNGTAIAVAATSEVLVWRMPLPTPTRYLRVLNAVSYSATEDSKIRLYRLDTGALLYESDDYDGLGSFLSNIFDAGSITGTYLDIKVYNGNAAPQDIQWSATIQYSGTTL